jgi:proteasome accessory factor C
MSARPVHNAKDQVARLLALVPYLHQHGTVRLDKAAADLGVAPKQLAKDLRVLFMCGLPGGYPDDLIDVDLDALDDPDEAVIRVSNADYLSRPMRLNPTEASALIVALRALRDGAGSAGTRDIVDRALAKLERAAAEGAARVEPAAIEPGVDTPDPGLAALGERLRAAVADGVQVRIDYWVPSRDELSTRVVDPHGVVTHQGHAYLDAWCHSAEAPRLFRLDRIREAQVLTTPVATAADGPRDLADGLFARSEDLQQVTLRVAPEAQWVVEYYPVEQVRALPEGGLEVDLLVTDARWLTRLLLRLAPHATVVAPEAMAQEFTARARAALSVYTYG